MSKERPKKVSLTYVRPTGLSNSQWNQVAKQAQSALRDVTPVRSGNLKSSVQLEKSTNRSVKVGFNKTQAPYACWVQAGNTRGAKAQDLTGQARAKLDQAVKKVKK